MASQAASLLEQHISCSVCLEIYSNPYALKCLHTFCYGCILRLKQGTHVQCPDCRKFTAMAEVQKDFKIQSFIDLHKQTTGGSSQTLGAKAEPTESEGATVSSPNKCSVCLNPDNEATAFCSTCDKFLCAECYAPHRVSQSESGYHNLMSVTEMPNLRKQIKAVLENLEKVHAEVETKCNEGRDGITNIQRAKVEQIAEMNVIRTSIKLQVDTHHDRLIKEIETASEARIESVVQQVRHLQQGGKKLQNKIDFLSDVSRSEDISLITGTLGTLAIDVDQELQQLHRDIAKMNTQPGPIFTIDKGEGWDPENSTALRKIATAPTPNEGDNREFAGPVLDDWDVEQNPPEEPMNKQLHNAYHQMYSVDTTSWPRKIRLYAGKIWVAGADKGILKYNSSGQCTQLPTVPAMTYVTSFDITPTGDIMVCDKAKGLLHLNRSGQCLSTVDSGAFSDVSISHGNMYALEFERGEVFHYCRTESNTWARENVFKLLYENGSIGDKVCAASNCVCISSYHNHTVYIHSVTGECYFQTDGRGFGQEVKFQYPHLCDIDSRGNLLVCVSGSHILKVYHSQTGAWSTILKLKEGRPVSAVVNGERQIWVGTAYPFRLLRLQGNQH